MALSPRTILEYRAALRRLGVSVGAHTDFGALAEAGELPHTLPRAAWEHLSNSGRLVMRAAVRWSYGEAGQAAQGKEIAEQIPLQHETRRLKQNPTHADVEAFVKGAAELPAPWRELLLIGVALGFRREELLNLERSAVQAALKSPEKVIRFVRKGSIEGELPIGHVITQFKTLLRHPGTLGRGATLYETAPAWIQLWQVAGSTYGAAYARLKRLVARVSLEAGCSTRWTPHVMRHAFASEMVRDGASLPAVQRALNHASYQTSLRYVHVDAADLTKWMKPRGEP